MPYATVSDGVRLYYEETGSGDPLIFVHEYAGNLEEPEAFNRAVLEFLTLVEQGRWGERDPCSVSGSVLGRKE